MNEQLTGWDIWRLQVYKSDLELQPIPPFFEAQLYRQLTILGDASFAVVEKNLMPRTWYDQMCSRLDRAKKRAHRTIAFECLPPDLILDKISIISENIEITALEEICMEGLEDGEY